MFSTSNILLFFLIASCSISAVQSLKCNFGVGRGVPQPYECSNENEKCWMGYTENVNHHGHTSYSYKCMSNNHQEVPEVNVNVHEDDISCYRNIRGNGSEQYQSVDCYCATDLCNTIKSPIHDEILNIVENITEHKYLECYDGYLHKSGFLRPPALIGCTAKKETVCSIGQFFGSAYLSNCGAAPKNLTVITGYNYPYNASCYFDGPEPTYIECICHTHRCNKINSSIHHIMEQIVQDKADIIFAKLQKTPISAIRAHQTNPIDGPFHRKMEEPFWKPETVYVLDTTYIIVDGDIGNAKSNKSESNTNLLSDDTVFELPWIHIEITKLMLILAVIVLFVVVVLICTICVCLKITANAEYE